MLKKIINFGKNEIFFQSTHNGEKIKNNKKKLKKNDFLMGLSSKGYDLIFFFHFWVWLWV